VVMEGFDNDGGVDAGEGSGDVRGRHCGLDVKDGCIWFGWYGSSAVDWLRWLMMGMMLMLMLMMMMYDQRALFVLYT
jgi:hypothetical protein